MGNYIEENPHFEAGNRGLLVFMGQRFVTSVLETTEDNLRVAYAVNEFPLAGMQVNLEFQDDKGFANYESEVLEPAREVGDGLLLSRPLDRKRNHHRMWWRIPADFRAEVKDHVHPRRVEAAVIDVSGGGMLLHCDHGHESGDNVDLFFRLPGDQKQHYALGQVVHCVETDHGRGRGHHVGIRFVNVDPPTGQAISRYVWRRIKKLHPA